jgi:hypothetical protein
LSYSHCKKQSWDHPASVSRSTTVSLPCDDRDVSDIEITPQEV